MFRFALNDMLSWKNREFHKPLLLLGARQVGKTWLMKEFARNNYKDNVYLNFDSQKEMLFQIFEGNLEPQMLLPAIELVAGKQITPGSTLLIFDEIQECPQALKSLKYFHESLPGLDIVAAGSLLGLSIHQGVSFPVGQVSFLPVFPMTFQEFLIAEGKEKIAELIQTQNWALIEIVKGELIAELRHYFCIGGMPGVIQNFLRNRNFNEARDIQRDICRSYEFDMDKHAPKDLTGRMRSVWTSLPSQLAKENPRFIYKDLKHGARMKDYEEALAWLIAMGIVKPLKRISAPEIPLSGFAEGDFFKLYSSDIGLLCAQADVSLDTFAAGNDVFHHFKGALTEQFVYQEMIAASQGETPINYWQSKGTAEVDFVAQVKNQIIPIEAKAGINLRARSLKVFMEKFNPPIGIRLSLSSYKENEKLIDVPLYAAGEVFNIAEKHARTSN